MSTGKKEQDETFVEKMRRDREENAELYRALATEPGDMEDVPDYDLGK